MTCNKITILRDVLFAGSNSLDDNLLINITTFIANDKELETLYTIFRKNKNKQNYCNLSCYLTSVITKIQKVYELTYLYMWDKNDNLVYKSTFPETNTYIDYTNGIGLDNLTISQSLNLANQGKGSVLTNTALNITYDTAINTKFKFAITFGAVIPNRNSTIP
jgi:hypothetical protein